ncbi:MAG: hypothetical protein ACJ75B_22310 [Flavisolibacter sp.]
MRKLFGLLTILFVLGISSAVHAQGILNKIKDKTKDKTEQRVDDKIDKAIDEALVKAEDVAKTSSDQSNSSVHEAAVKTSDSR